MVAFTLLAFVFSAVAVGFVVYQITNSSSPVPKITPVSVIRAALADTVGAGLEGSSVAISGNDQYVAMTCPEDDYQDEIGSRGAVFVFKKSGVNEWNQQAKLTPGGEVLRFGDYSVVIDSPGSTLVSPSAGNHLELYYRIGSEWTFGGELPLAAGRTGDCKLGTSLVMTPDGSRVVAGGPNNNSNRGAFWVYDRTSYVAGVPVYSLNENGPVTSSTVNGREGAGVAISSNGATIVSLLSGDKSILIYQAGEGWQPIQSKLSPSNCATLTGVCCSQDGTIVFAVGTATTTGKVCVWRIEATENVYAIVDQITPTDASNNGTPGAISTNADGMFVGFADRSDGCFWVYKRNSEMSYDVIGAKRDVISQTLNDFGVGLATNPTGSRWIVSGSSDDVTNPPSNGFAYSFVGF